MAAEVIGLGKQKSRPAIGGPSTRGTCTVAKMATAFEEKLPKNGASILAGPALSICR
jgi:hypothetical protein